MRNIAIFLRYDGSDFHGFQVQKNASSIQSTVQNALENLFGHKTTVSGCSRTDAGVHAKMYCILTKTDTQIPAAGIVQGLNVRLPEAIAAYAAYEVDDSFHPRYSAIAKEYEYHIYLGKSRNPFFEKYAYWFPKKFDTSLAIKAAPMFVGKHDFAGFMSSGSDIEDTVRTVYMCEAELNGHELVVRIKADGFLYNMVRIIAGTLIDIACGKIDINKLPEIIESKDRSRAGFTAPAKGLFLAEVEYKDGVFENGYGE